MSHELHSENARLVMVQTLARMFRFTCEQVWSGRVSSSLSPVVADMCVILVEDASPEVRPQGRLALAAYLSRWPDHAAEVISRLSPAGQRSFVREAPSSLAIENAAIPAVTKISTRPSLQALRRQALGQRNVNGESADA